ncbi:MAG: radical SAM protein, partial [Chitinivibrionales bacterium]|nr:radical SAM protein [Chitinivibrionales bacterium]
MRLLDARLDLSRRCNYRCVYCGEPENGPENPVFPLANMEVIFPVLNRYCWSVYLSCGGEPTLHPDFAGALLKVKALLTKPDVSIVTNGYNLTPAHIGAIVGAGLSRVYISIDSIDDD